MLLYENVRTVFVSIVLLFQNVTFNSHSLICKWCQFNFYFISITIIVNYGTLVSSLVLGVRLTTDMIELPSLVKTSNLLGIILSIKLIFRCAGVM